jgi:hypothetical protein
MRMRQERRSIKFAADFETGFGRVCDRLDTTSSPHLGHVCGTPGVDFITEHWGDAGLARLNRPKVPT